MYYTDDNNQKLQTNIMMKQIVPTHTSTTAATQPEDLTSSRRFTRVMLPEPSSKKVLSPTAAQSTVKNTLPALAEAMETLREKIIVLRYHIQAGNAVSRDGKRTIQSEKATLAKYTSVAEQITAKKKERKELQNKKKATPVLWIAIQRDLSRQIAELTGKFEELKSEKLRLLKELKCADENGIPKVQSEIDRIETALAALDETEKKNSSKLNKTIQRYKDLKKQSAAFDQGELAAARSKIRPEKQLSAENKLQSSYSKNFSIRNFFSAIHETDKTLNDSIDLAAAKEFENRLNEQPRRKASGRTK